MPLFVSHTGSRGERAEVEAVSVAIPPLVILVLGIFHQLGDVLQEKRFQCEGIGVVGYFEFGLAGAQYV